MYAYIDLPYPNVGKYGSPMGCLGIAPGPPQRPNPSPVDPPAPGIFQVEDLRDQMMLKGIPVHYPASEALAERLERKPGVVAQSVASRGVPSVWPIGFQVRVESARGKAVVTALFGCCCVGRHL